MSRIILKNIIEDKKDYKGDVLMHISDTPLISLQYIKRLIGKISVKYLIHTGDFIDNLKTTHPLFEKKDYERALSKFVSKLENFPVKYVYLVPGNHDDLSVLEKYKNMFNIVTEGNIINISGISFSVAHDYHNLKEISKDNKIFYLYGHNRYKNGRDNFLNGYCSINIIFIDNLKVYKIPYPFYVNIIRGKNQLLKIGL